VDIYITWNEYSLGCKSEKLIHSKMELIYATEVSLFSTLIPGDIDAFSTFGMSLKILWQ